MRNSFSLIVLALLLLSFGCARFGIDRKVNYRTFTGSPGGDPYSAELHFEEAIQLLCENNLCDAEQALHQALICDESYGPAHNALGKIYFDQEKYYLAAWEFEHSSRLMPLRPEPLNNLGLVYEEVGQIEKAISYYHQANAADESNPQFLGNLIRARMKRGDRTSDLYIMLERLALIDDRPVWREWAMKQLALNRVDQPEELLPFEPTGLAPDAPSQPKFQPETFPTDSIEPVEELPLGTELPIELPGSFPNER